MQRQNAGEYSNQMSILYTTFVEQGFGAHRFRTLGSKTRWALVASQSSAVKLCVW